MPASRPSTERHVLDAGGGVAVEMVSIVAAADGPTVAILGGVHGDELEGVTASRLIIRAASETLLAGRLLIVPIANPSAFAARTRTTPADGANLARCFPGDAGGTETERLAEVLTRRVIAGADLLIDLHSAGAAYAMPVFVGCVSGDDDIGRRSTDVATTFGAPLGWQHAVMNPGRSLSAALELGIPAVYVEGGGGAGLVQSELATYVDGVLNVLADGGQMSPSWAPRPPTSRWIVGGDGDVDASLSTPVDGWCVTAVAAGDTVAAGQIIAEILDDDGDLCSAVVAPRDATVMMLRRHAAVVAGDGIAMLGPTVSDSIASAR